MSTGYGWEGIRQVDVRRCLVGAMYLSASVVAMSTWGAITLYPLPRPLKSAAPGSAGEQLLASLAAHDRTDTPPNYIRSCDKAPFIPVHYQGREGCERCSMCAHG